MKTPRNTKGFTLVELLVVIAIMMVLATLVFVMSAKMIKKGRMAKSVSNMRQISGMMLAYSADNNNSLPAMRRKMVKSDGSTVDLHWHQAILFDLYPDNEEQILTDREWWIATDPIVKNPLFTKETNVQFGQRFEPWYPGYGLNQQIWELTPTPSPATATMDPAWPVTSKPVPLAFIPEPARTPLIASHFDWHLYQFLSGTALKNPAQNDQFLIDGKMNILFVDGHSEMIRFTDSKGKAMPVCEYVERKLHLQPVR